MKPALLMLAGEAFSGGGGTDSATAWAVAVAVLCAVVFGVAFRSHQSTAARPKARRRRRRGTAKKGRR